MIAGRINQLWFSLFFLLFTNFSAGQEQIKIFKSANCDNTNVNINPDYINKYKQIESYIPDEDSPIKHIRIAVNIFTGPGTMQQADTTIAAVKNVVVWLNDFYAHVDSATYPIAGVPWLRDTKIRFDLDERIFFYEGTKLYTATAINQLEKHVANIDPGRLDNLNIYITNGGKASPYSLSPFPNFILDNHSGSYSSSGNLAVYISSVSPNYVNAQTLAHEIGHCLDLLHTYEPSCCHETCNASDPEYLYDLFGRNPPAYCWEKGHFACKITPGENTCTNNIMGGNNMLNYYFSPMQIGKMHRSLSIKSGKKYIKEDVYDDRAYKIKKNENWNFDIRWYSDIVIERGTTLTITGKIIMPEQGKIIVKRGSKLIVDGGTIMGIRQKWEGMEVKKNSNGLQRLLRKEGELELKNGAVVENIGINGTLEK